MEFVNAQFRQISSQLKGLSTSGKIAIGLLTLIFIVGLAGMITWSGGSDWAPVLDQAMTPDQIQRAQAEFMFAGVRSKVEGDRLLIEGGEEKRREVLAMLAQRGALPADTSISYASLIKDTNPFVGERKAMWMETRGLEAALASVLRQFRGVRDAKVLIQVPEHRGFGRTAAQSTASVVLTLQEGDVLDKQRVAAVAQFVAGAVKGLKIENVSITDGVRSYRAPNPNEAIPTELLDLQRQQEEHFRQKIANQLQHIRGVVVGVQATLRSDEEQERVTKHDEKLRLLEEETTTESATDAASAAEPSVRPNTALGMKGGETGSKTEREDNKARYNPDTGGSVKTVDRRAGAVMRVTAAVSIPRTFLERIFKQEQAANKNDPGNSVEKVAEKELKKIADQIRPLIDAKDDTQVAVAWHYDEPEETPTTSQAAAGAMGMITEHGPRAALGLLAFLSILAVVMMARKAQAALKGGPAGAAPAMAMAGGVPMVGSGEAAAGGGMPAWLGGSAAIGEVGESEGVLIGREVDERVIRTHRMIEQIGQMIKEDPESAANLVQQWVDQPR